MGKLASGAGGGFDFGAFSGWGCRLGGVPTDAAEDFPNVPGVIGNAKFLAD